MKDIYTLYEASILDIDGTIKTGTEYYEEAEKELAQLVKEFTNVRNWKKYNIYCYDFLGGCEALGKVLGNNANLFEFIIDKYDGIGYVIKFVFKEMNGRIRNRQIFARIDLPLEKYSKIHKATGSNGGPNISKIIKEFIKYFSDVETLKEFLKKNAVDGYFYERS